MHKFDPNVKTEEAAGQPANAEAANVQESASQDQATGAESAEEGSTEG